MLAWLRQWRDRREKARSLYGSIVTQARARPFYARWGVPDTPEGRFELIALHLVLVLDRLAGVGEGRRLGRALMEAFVADLDDTLREMTVGDLAVPRQVKRAVGALQDRYASYRAALAASDEDALFATVQARLGEAGGSPGLDAWQVCGYIREAKLRLDLTPGSEVLAGRVAWPQTDALGAVTRTVAE